MSDLILERLKSDIRNSQHLLPGLTGTGGSTRYSLFREGGQTCHRQQISHLQCRACMNLCCESKKPEKEIKIYDYFFNNEIDLQSFFTYMK